MKRILGMVINCACIPLTLGEGHHQVSEGTKLIMLLHKEASVNQVCLYSTEGFIRNVEKYLKKTLSI